MRLPPISAFFLREGCNARPGGRAAAPFRTPPPAQRIRFTPSACEGVMRDPHRRRTYCSPSRWLDVRPACCDRPPPPRHERRQVRRCNRRGVSTDRSRCPHFTRKNGEWRRMRSFSFPPPTRKRSTISALHPRCRVVCEVSRSYSKGFGSCLRPLERLSSWSKSPIPPFFISSLFQAGSAPREPYEQAA